MHNETCAQTSHCNGQNNRFRALLTKHWNTSKLYVSSIARHCSSPRSKVTLAPPGTVSPIRYEKYSALPHISRQMYASLSTNSCPLRPLWEHWRSTRSGQGRFAERHLLALRARWREYACGPHRTKCHQRLEQFEGSQLLSLCRYRLPTACPVAEQPRTAAGLFRQRPARDWLWRP